jgi:hypothetical protein
MARSPPPVHTGFGTHTVSYKMGTRFFFQGVKLSGHGVNRPPPSSAEVKERVELYLFSLSPSLSLSLSLSETSWPVVG